VRRAGFPIAALLSRDPKTVSMRIDLYMPFGEREAEWKAELLRFHDSQHQRNLNTRGHGFDERILTTNRHIARELGIDAPYAEAFELVVPAGGQQTKDERGPGRIRADGQGKPEDSARR